MPRPQQHVEALAHERQFSLYCCMQSPHDIQLWTSHRMNACMRARDDNLSWTYGTQQKVSLCKRMSHTYKAVVCAAMLICRHAPGRHHLQHSVCVVKLVVKFKVVFVVHENPPKSYFCMRAPRDVCLWTYSCTCHMTSILLLHTFTE